MCSSDLGGALYLFDARHTVPAQLPGRGRGPESRSLRPSLLNPTRATGRASRQGGWPTPPSTDIPHGEARSAGAIAEAEGEEAGAGVGVAAGLREKSGRPYGRKPPAFGEPPRRGGHSPEGGTAGRRRDAVGEPTAPLPLIPLQGLRL